ncbi:MAG TPA: hypothetical protein VLK84_03060 [Longimicrobium sp.]|nr:hypothetical protein [Longimicrobium sp.]
MTIGRILPLALPIAAALLCSAGEVAAQEPQTLAISGFAIEHSITVPGTPAEAYDAITGDISGWWDHHYAENPVRLYIEPTVGGCFCEIFDAEGNGARHATVTYAERGKALRFEGPLGLGGNALTMVHTYEFTPVADSTRVTVKVRAFGEIQDGWPAAVNGVWRHFLVERFKPWYERRRAGS